MSGPIFFVDTLFEKLPQGGVHSFVFDLLPGLRARGVDAQLITEVGALSAHSEELARQGVPVHRALYNRSRHLPASCGKRIAAFVNRHQGALYVINNSTDAGWLALPWLAERIPACAIGHNDVSAYYEPVRHYRSYLSDVAGVSTLIADRLRQLSGSSQPSTWLPYGVFRAPAESIACRPSSDFLKLLYVGRLETVQKRVERLIGIAEALKASGVSYSLSIVGEGSFEPRLRDALTKIGGHFTFYGFLSREQIRPLLLDSDALLLVSDYEGLPLVVLEAMATGVIPIAMETKSGVGDVIENSVNGFLVPCGDTLATAEVVTSLAASPAHRAGLQAAAWESSSDYSVEAMVARYTLWLRAVSDGRPKRPAHHVAPMLSCKSRYPAWIRRLRLLARRSNDIEVGVRPNMVSSNPRCRACGEAQTIAQGSLILYGTRGIVSKALDPPLLWTCSNCALQFKYPIPTADSLLDEYRDLDPEGLWEHGPRAVWLDLKRQMPERGGRVLDVGCFRSDFLASLGPLWTKFGVELSSSAAQCAKDNGIRVVASDIGELQQLDESFDVITLIDVIEHIPDPAGALKDLIRLLAPGGRLLIVTGNTSALSWRFSGVHYWYSALPEHVSFVCPAWFRYMAPRLGFKIHSCVRCVHRPANLVTRIDQAFKAAVFRCYTVLPASVGRRRPLSRVAQWDVPWWTAAKDHLLIVVEPVAPLKRPSSHYRRRRYDLDVRDQRCQ